VVWRSGQGGLARATLGPRAMGAGGTCEAAKDEARRSSVRERKGENGGRRRCARINPSSALRSVAPSWMATWAVPSALDATVAATSAL
jgi:hypothetical protein